MENTQEQQPQTQDISSRTILVLVVLVVVFSFVGAWVNINQALSAPSVDAPRAVGPNAAQVGFVIQKPLQSKTSGEVVLRINEKP